MNKKRKINLINDMVYNHIEYNALEGLFLQTKIVNRMHFVTQNALAYFAFPSINTKRYIHSLGTMHMISYIFQYSLGNADSGIKNGLLEDLKNEINRVITDNHLDIDIDNFSPDDNALYNFYTPVKRKDHFNVYMIILQSLRLTGLLHDVGHLPFSHQSEYALEEVNYRLGKKKGLLNEAETIFVENYDKLTNGGNKALHEKIGEELLEKLFLDEIMDINNEVGDFNKDYIRLQHILVKNIFEEKNRGFNYKLLHKYVSGTIDADRLDYLNRDSLASGHLSGPQDTIKLAKYATIVKKDNEYYLSFLNDALWDIETALTNRFNLYKKVIYSSDIVKYDSLLEEVIVYVIMNNLDSNYKTETLYKSISMLWRFLEKDNKVIENVSQLDENWLITILKKEYFKLLNQSKKSFTEQKFIKSFEVILFGRNHYNNFWNNLNEFFEYLGWNDEDKKGFYTKITLLQSKKKYLLMHRLSEFIKKIENKYEGTYLIYSLVDFSIGINDSFSLTDGVSLVRMNKVSTVKERLKRSKLNTVPFFLYVIKSKSFDDDDFKIQLQNFLKDDFLKE